MSNSTNEGFTTNVSRRGFVQGAAAGMAGLGLAAVAAPALARRPLQPSPRLPRPLMARLPQINPQDYSYTTNSITDFSQTQLFSEWQLGTHTLHHRMVKSAAFQLASWRPTPTSTLPTTTAWPRAASRSSGSRTRPNFWDMTASPMKQDYSAY